MIIQSLFFYFFSLMAILSSLMVVTARNPVNAVFYLIFAFLNASGLFLLLGAEFIAMITLVAYVGAVIVLFLFVIMMIDVDFEESKPKIKLGFLGAFFIGILVAELITGVSSLIVFGTKGEMFELVLRDNNIERLGSVLYTNYAYTLEIAGFILLLSMVGAIVLTLRHRRNIKRQDVAKQLKSNPINSVEVVKVKSGQGI